MPLNARQMVSLYKMPFWPYMPFSVTFSLVSHHLVVRFDGVARVEEGIVARVRQEGLKGEGDDGENAREERDDAQG